MKSKSTVQRRGLTAAAACMLLLCAALAGSLVSTRHVLGDSAELAGVLAEPGIAHPPGYAAYTMLGHVWGLLLRALSGARISWLLSCNLFSLAWYLLAVYLWLLIYRRLVGPRARRSVGALILACALLLFWATHPQALLLSATTEVYTMHLALVALSWWLALRAWQSRRYGLPTAGLIFTQGAVGALGCLHHPTFICCAIPILLLTVIKLYQRRKSLSPAAWLKGCALALSGVAIGALTLLYFPLRGRQHPRISMYDLSTGWKNIWRLVTAAQYRVYLSGGVAGGDGFAGFISHLPPFDRWLLLAMLLVIAVPLARFALALLRRRVRFFELCSAALALQLLLSLTFNSLYAISDISEYMLPVWWIGALLLAVTCARRTATVTERLNQGIALLILCIALGWAIENRTRVASHLETQHLICQRIINLWNGLPLGPATVLTTGDHTGLLEYEQIIEASRPDLTLYEMNNVARVVVNLQAAAVELNIAPVVFYDETQNSKHDFGDTLSLGALIKRNIWARAPRRIIDFDAALRHGPPQLRAATPTPDFALELLRAGLCAPGDIIPLHKTMQQYAQKTGHPLLGFSPEKWQQSAALSGPR